MIELAERVEKWMTRLEYPQLSQEMLSLMRDVPEEARDIILEAVNSDDDSAIKFCADSFVKYGAQFPPRSGMELSESLESMFSLLPYFAVTYADFAPPADEMLAFNTFYEINEQLSSAVDTPSNFVYDRIVESHLDNIIHGIVVLSLIEGYDSRDQEWLGQNREQLAPFASVLRDRDEVDKEFCEFLMAHHSSIANGSL